MSSLKTAKASVPAPHHDPAIEAFLETITDGFFALDSEWIITYANAEAERLCGMKREDMIGRNHWELFPGSIGTIVEREFRRAVGERVAVDFTNYFAPWQRWFHVKASPATGGGLSVFFEDITDRKVAENERTALLERERPARDEAQTLDEVAAARRMAAEGAQLLLGAIVDSSDDAIISKDLNGVITSWNHSAQRLFGYTAGEAIGQTVASLLIPADRQDEEPDILARLQRGERVDHFETVRRRKDGSLLDISLTISPVKDPQGRIVGASKIARDITQRKTYEQRLAEQAHLLDLTGDAILVRDQQDRVVDWNRAAEEMYGYTRAEAQGKVSHKLLRTQFPEPLPEILERLSRDGHWSGELSHARRDGSRIVTLSRWIAERDEKGGVVRILETNNDITERVRVQDELRRANQDLEQFAYTASHDLQEPLRTIKIYSELLLANHAAAEGEDAEYLGYLRNAATRMELLVRDLLIYTQMNRIELPSQDLDAAEALSAAMANLQGAIAESAAAITFDKMPRLRVHTTHLQQLFQNLLSNGIKYRDSARPPVLHVGAEKRNGSWIFSVRDNGIGIRPEYKEKIFGLFTRLHGADRYSGTGIGLAICQRIVERYHGRIWVESEPGKGSDFRFTIPG